MSGNSQYQSGENGNVIPLFSGIDLQGYSDPLQDLLLEGVFEEYVLASESLDLEKKYNLVTQNQFPDQSIYILDQQLSGLKETMSRLKFYLSDLDDLLPR